MTMRYILRGHDAVVEPDPIKWAEWMEHHPDDRIVGKTPLPDGGRVSTVFLGLDHRWVGDGPPLVFETMIFSSDKHDGYQERCSTWNEAVAQHQRAIDIVAGRVTE